MDKFVKEHVDTKAICVACHWKNGLVSSSHLDGGVSVTDQVSGQVAQNCKFELC